MFTKSFQNSMFTKMTFVFTSIKNAKTLQSFREHRCSRPDVVPRSLPWKHCPLFEFFQASHLIPMSFFFLFFLLTSSGCGTLSPSCRGSSFSHSLMSSSLRLSSEEKDNKKPRDETNWTQRPADQGQVIVQYWISPKSYCDGMIYCVISFYTFLLSKWMLLSNL